MKVARRGLARGPRIGSLSRCDSLGEGMRIFGHPYVENWGRMEIGPHVVIRAEPVRCHLVTAPRGVLLIGDGAVIEHGAGITAHLSIQIGAGARIGPFALVMDTAFHDPDDPSKRPEPRPISIGEGAIIGSHATVLPGSRIGAGARVFAGSVVAGFVPPGARVRGVPAAVAEQIPGTRVRALALR